MRKLAMAAAAAAVMWAGQAGATIFLDFQFPAEDPTIDFKLAFTAEIPYLPSLFNAPLPAGAVKTCPSFNAGPLACGVMELDPDSVGRGRPGDLNATSDLDSADILDFGFGSGVVETFFFEDGAFGQDGSYVSIGGNAGARLIISGTADALQPEPDGYVPPVPVGGSGVGGVPEPASWSLLIAGFGLAGAALRRRRVLA